VRVVLLNSANYGSAQNRERVLFLCRRGKDFIKKEVEKTDDSKRFRDVRDMDSSNFSYVKETPRNIAKIQQKDLYPFDLVGGWDRVGTLTTGIAGGGGRNPSSQQKIVQESGGGFRYMTLMEAERLQGFPDGWTAGEREGARWFALGNAVNCNVSDYLFNNYLKGVWF
jgi:site-specific DNA-cytosine methylase